MGHLLSDIAIVSLNGTVTSLFGSSGAAVINATECQGPGTANVEIQSASTAPSISGSGADTHFYTTNQVGTAQLEFSSGGWLIWQGQFAPYGQQIQNGVLLAPDQTDASINHYKFTGKERDAESGLDYFGARYYSSAMGRFMSPDPSGLAFADPTNPQTPNLYSYALNNPLKNTDPTGLYCYYGDPDSTSDGFNSSQYDFHSSQGECTQPDENGNSGKWIDDAYTHNGVDDDNRPGEAVSSNTQTSQPSGFPINQPIGYDLLSSLPRYSLQFSGQVQVAGTVRPMDQIGRWPPPLSPSEIRNWCAVAVSLAGGGTVPGGSVSGTASGSPFTFGGGGTDADNTMPVPSSKARYGGQTMSDVAHAPMNENAAKVDNPLAVAALAGSWADCVNQISAANR